ncbi:hypothetical protein IFM61606_03065 [Aspergillus udagawae]|uniref:Uncharacterized protein n=1 Tax=Aspergillus udagawae TaxID=91492 RepID=A0ABQ1AMM3_9EURO|nr:hypothetical protein IFM53868_04230 [Aspergillus udagawae]GFG23190.1 hypothetical protein IFM61606_03065 [Aspergillus udagawae]
MRISEPWVDAEQIGKILDSPGIQHWDKRIVASNDAYHKWVFATMFRALQRYDPNWHSDGKCSGHGIGKEQADIVAPSIDVMGSILKHNVYALA